MEKDKKDLLNKSLLLFMLLILIVAGSFWLVKNVGMGKTRNELNSKTAKEKLKKFIKQNKFVDELSEIKGYEFSLEDPAKMNYAFQFKIDNEKKKQWLVEHLQCKSDILKGNADIFLEFDHPDWWKPGNVSKGYYYTSHITINKYFLIYDMDSGSVFFLII